MKGGWKRRNAERRKIYENKCRSGMYQLIIKQNQV